MNRIKGFTLAEVLITLAIIGVVAALTIPSVIINHKKTMYVTQLKKEYSQIIKAFHTAMARDGVTRLSDTKLITSINPTRYEVWSGYWETTESLSPSNMEKSENAEAKAEFLKTFNVIEIYDGKTKKIPFYDNKITKIGDDYYYLPLHGRPTTGGGEYRLNNGVCLADGACFTFYLYKTPNAASCGDHPCSSLQEFQTVKNTPTKFWQSIGSLYIDVNGFIKGPNQCGRDYFWFEIGNDGNLYPDYGIDATVKCCDTYANVMANNASSYWRHNNNVACSTDASSWGGLGCAARVIEEGWKMNY